LGKVVKSYFKVMIFVLQWRGEVNFGHRYPSGGKGENCEKRRQFGSWDLFWYSFGSCYGNIVI